MATNVRDDVAASGGPGFVAFIDLLRHPNRGWRRIAVAPASIATLLIGVTLPLAALRPLAGLAHDLLYGRGSMGIIQYRPTTGGAVIAALAGWILWVAALVALALVIAALAPRFGGRSDRGAALKVATFGSGPFFLTSLLMLVPAIDFLQLLGLYSLFLLAIGAARLLKVPGEKAGLLGPAVAGIAFVLAVVALILTGTIARRSLEPTVETAQGRVVVTAAPAITGAKLSAPAMSKNGAAIPVAGDGVAVPASALQALLPERIGDFTRTAVESQSAVSAGVATADAKATYIEGTNSFTLTIADAGQTGALATGNSVIAGEVNRITDQHYERSRVVNGVRIVEKWNYADRGGSYSRVVAGRFTVEAQGTAPGIETLRGAVGSIDAGRLAALDR